MLVEIYGEEVFRKSSCLLMGFTPKYYVVEESKTIWRAGLKPNSFRQFYINKGQLSWDKPEDILTEDEINLLLDLEDTVPMTDEEYEQYQINDKVPESAITRDILEQRKTDINNTNDYIDRELAGVSRQRANAATAPTVQISGGSRLIRRKNCSLPLSPDPAQPEPKQVPPHKPRTMNYESFRRLCAACILRCRPALSSLHR